VTCVYRVEFPPGLKLLSANGRSSLRAVTVTSNWKTSRKTKIAIHEMAFDLAKKQRIPRLGAVRIRVYYYPPDRRRRDSPNILFWSSKCAIDGFTEAGVLPDDSDKYVRGIEFIPGGRVVRGGQMVIEIEET
jgi:Holliday junction resolvase RusA-like endonuclease